MANQAARQPDSEGEPGRPPSGSEPIRLADGVELIGEYDDSGFKEPPSIARRGDGQVVQLSALLYTIAANADGSHSLEQIAEAASRETGKTVSPDNVVYLVEKKLRPLGILAGADGSSPQLRRNDPMLALRLRTAVVPEGAVNLFATVFRPLFWPPVVLGVLGALIAFNVWLFFIHGVAGSVGQVLNQPLLFLLLFALIIVSTAFHEVGHATACRYGGARPGPLGAGIYVVWPVFYSDVTDAYRLDKGGRLRTDLGGVYFNVVFLLLVAALYLTTHLEPLLVFTFLLQIEILHQFLPFLRLDGYYVIADLTGVPDMFPRIKPILASFIPGRQADKAVTELKGWVRAVVTLWVLLTALFVLYFYGAMLVATPRVLATAWVSGSRIAAAVVSAAQHSSWAAVAVGVIELVLLALPILGFAYAIVSGARALVLAGWTRTEGRPLLRTGFVTVMTGALVLLVVSWLPRPQTYRPIQPGETGTIQAGVSSFGSTVVRPAVQAVPGASSVVPLPPASQASPAAAGAAAGASPPPAGSPSSQPTASPTAAAPAASPSP